MTKAGAFTLGKGDSAERRDRSWEALRGARE